MASQTYTPRVDPAPKVAPILSGAGKATSGGGSGSGSGAADGAAGAGGGDAPAGLRGDERKPDVFRDIRTSCTLPHVSSVGGCASFSGPRRLLAASTAALFTRVPLRVACAVAQRCASGNTVKRLGRRTSSLAAPKSSVHCTCGVTARRLWWYQCRTPLTSSTTVAGRARYGPRSYSRASTQFSEQCVLNFDVQFAPFACAGQRRERGQVSGCGRRRAVQSNRPLTP